MTTETSVTATGRMWGYTDEVDAVERLVKRVVATAPVTFTITDRKVIGSRGFFTRRFVSKYEYEVTGPTRDEVSTYCEIITAMAKDMIS